MTESTCYGVDLKPETLQLKCTLCPAQFNEKHELHSHVRDHFEPITCAECNKTFIGDKQYNYHLKLHTGKVTIKEMSEDDTIPDIVPKKRKLRTSDNMQNETCILDISGDLIESVTGNVGCDVCGRLFPSIAAVVRHRKTHTNEGKRFFCNVCHNGFNKKTNLEFHMRIHTNER